jgi:hypothetical protein
VARAGALLVGVFQTNLEAGGSVGAISGIDWASDWHDVHIADQQGGVLDG